MNLVAGHSLNKGFIIIAFGSLFASIIAYGSEGKASMLTDIHFFSGGSGRMSITANGDDIYTLAEMFGIPKGELSKHSLDFYLKAELESDKIGLKTESVSIKTGSTSATATVICSFSSPDAVVKFLDDDITIKDKYIKWGNGKVELQIRFGVVYDKNVTYTYVFRFDGYNIKNANDIVLNSNTVSWQADFGASGVKTLHLIAERESAGNQ